MESLKSMPACYAWHMIDSNGKWLDWETRKPGELILNAHPFARQKMPHGSSCWSSVIWISVTSTKQKPMGVKETSAAKIFTTLIARDLISCLQKNCGDPLGVFKVQKLIHSFSPINDANKALQLPSTSVTRQILGSPLVFSEFTRTNPGRPRPTVEKMVVSPVYARAGGDGTALNCLYVLCVWNTYSSTNMDASTDIDVHWHIMTATRILECVHDFIVLSNESKPQATASKQQNQNLMILRAHHRKVWAATDSCLSMRREDTYAESNEPCTVQVIQS